MLCPMQPCYLPRTGRPTSCHWLMVRCAITDSVHEKDESSQGTWPETWSKRAILGAHSYIITSVRRLLLLLLHIASSSLAFETDLEPLARLRHGTRRPGFDAGAGGPHPENCQLKARRSAFSARRQSPVIHRSLVRCALTSTSPAALYGKMKRAMGYAATSAVCCAPQASDTVTSLPRCGRRRVSATYPVSCQQARK